VAQVTLSTIFLQFVDPNYTLTTVNPC